MKLSKNELIKYKSVHRKITMVTGYDYPCAAIADECGIDVVLVGDSLGTNVLGYTETSQVTIEDMLHHVRAVARGVKRAYILADLLYRTLKYDGYKPKWVMNITDIDDKTIKGTLAKYGSNATV